MWRGRRPRARFRGWSFGSGPGIGSSCTMLAKKLGDFTVEVGLLGQKPSVGPLTRGDQPWLASPLHQKGQVAETFLTWPAWPAPTPAVATSTASTPPTSASSSGSASTSTSDAYTAPP